MTLQKKTVLTDLHWILTSTAPNPRFYYSRCIGFKAEKKVDDLLRKKKSKVMDGGQLVFAKKEERKPDDNVILYYTVSGDDKKKYAGLYKKLAKLRGMKSLFFIHFDCDSAGTEKIRIKRAKRTMTNKKGRKVTKERITEIDVLKPSMKVFEFSRGRWKSSGFQEIKNYLKSTSTTRKPNPSVSAYKTSTFLNYMRPWSTGDIWKIYCNRYVLNVEFNGFQTNMMDLDAIIKVKNDYITIEQKEKDPIGKWDKKKKKKVEDEAKWKFGWDTRRFAWYLFLKFGGAGIDTWYLVREVEDQQKRKFRKWKKITLDGFTNSVKWWYETPTGRGSTVQADYSAFEDF